MSAHPPVDSLLAGVGTPDVDRVMPHRYRRVGDHVLVTSDLGDWCLVRAEDYPRYLRGELGPDDPVGRELAEHGLLADHLDADAQAERLARKMSYLRHGPHLHVVVATLRCDHTCRYCHASRVPVQRPGYDMSKETAERVVDTILQSPSPFLTIEFQGGEPLANFPVVKHIVEYAEERNRRIGKQLTFSLVTNLSMMDDERLDWLTEHRVEICTSLDGPAELHDDNRLWAGGGSSQRRVVEWIRRINERYVDMGLDPMVYRVEALLTITKQSLPYWREIIDTYVDVGCQALFLRPLNPYGFAQSLGQQIAYPVEEWLDFYRKSLDYILQLNRRGIDLVERNAGILLTKVLTPDDPNFLDLRSPCGAAIGQLAYNWDGQVFTCDEGRMVHRSGEDLFRLGDVQEQSYREMVGHDAARAMVMSSTLDGQPGCVDCAYQPFCGICPVHNYTEQGSLSGRMMESSWCARYMGVLDHLFELLVESRSDPELDAILRRWTTGRPRTHFVHGPE
ncbi:MAG: His-Xaa-Ser system radical SAM maturase HxsB [Myxococcota bacterium]